MKQSHNGESFFELIGYWLPELIILCITVALPPLFDAYLIASLHSTLSYGALGMATNFLHTLVKLSEAIPIAAIAVIGRHNGAKNHAASGAHFINTLVLAILLGLLQLIIIYYAAPTIYAWLGVPPAMAIIGAPFLRLRSVSVLFAFMLLTVLGFMRAIKNTKTPMLITVFGSGIYLATSSILVSGYGTIPAYGLYGPAIAALLEYGIMLCLSLWLLATQKEYQPYRTHLTLKNLSITDMYTTVRMSIPIIIDKSSLAFAYVWLAKMLASLGPVAIASFDIIKNLERSAIMPAAAFAQVATMLISNHLGAQDRTAAYATTLSILRITSIIATTTISILCIFAPFFISLLSPDAAVSIFALPLLRIVSCLVIFDFIQLILAGALRGAGNVKTVMWTRFLSCGLFFLPISYILSHSSIENSSLKFCLIYSAFYINTAVMGLIFWFRLRSSDGTNVSQTSKENV